MSKLPQPFNNAIIFEDKKLYACLANQPIVPGHVVVVWKAAAKDLSVLTKKNFKYLMAVVDDVRSAMMKALKVKKVYLVYMDEISHVHWHLIPRYHEKGFDVFQAKSGKIKDFSLDDKIKQYFKRGK